MFSSYEPPANFREHLSGNTIKPIIVTPVEINIRINESKVIKNTLQYNESLKYKIKTGQQRYDLFQNMETYCCDHCYTMKQSRPMIFPVTGHNYKFTKKLSMT